VAAEEAALNNVHEKKKFQNIPLYLKVLKGAKSRDFSVNISGRAVHVTNH
jgi:hypothetical protein